MRGRSLHPFRILDPAAATHARGPFDLVVDRGAFGGGTHPTTQSCLGVLAGLAPLAGQRVVDVGSGSGILALAALRLGATSALCVDVNPEAVEIARRNGALNREEDRLGHRCGTAADVGGEAFDLVVANIGGEALLDEAADVAALVRPGGRLLVSGLLAGWADALEAAYGRYGCRAVDRRLPGPFCTLLLARDRAP
jgi:ribosomal protein L11 methyltransferase